MYKRQSLQSYPWRQDILSVKLHPCSLPMKAGHFVCKITSLQSYPWRQDILSVKLHPCSLPMKAGVFVCKITTHPYSLPVKAGLFVSKITSLQTYQWRQEFFVCKITSLQFTCKGRICYNARVSAISLVAQGAWVGVPYLKDEASWLMALVFGREGW